MPDASSTSAKAQFALKTALSLTLAFMLPMALGWPQPQTAAITVMLIAATGMVSESLQKGVLRLLGTVLGAIIGLTLIALFPQDRMLYLFSVSLAVAILLYLYNAYQGDSTLFMLAAVVTLMVFNGGDADGAFMYGVNRTLLTAFGVLVYTLVASLLWPVKVEDNTLELAEGVSGAHREAFSHLVTAEAAEPKAMEALLKKNELFQSHFVTVRRDEEQILSYRAEWDTIASSFEQLNELLVPALQTHSLEGSSYQKYIPNYEPVIENIKAMQGAIQGNWRKQWSGAPLETIGLTYNTEALEGETHLTVAAVVARADLLVKLQDVLLNLWRTTNSLLHDQSGFTTVNTFRGKPSFIWLDRENFKTAIRVFVSFWIATAVWIQFNPPGGFTFVTLSTALVVLVSYTPLAPKLLYILFTIGFLFAVPAYIFLLPQITHWMELGAFVFAYAFIGFYFFAGPLSIFFMLGLMTLGIQNTMNYNFNVILNLILLFYLVCTSLVVSVYFPFTSKPQLLYISFRRRFFKACGNIILASTGKAGPVNARLINLQLLNATALSGKMALWGARINPKDYPLNPPEKIAAFNMACAVLLEQLKILASQNTKFSQNALVGRVRTLASGEALASLCGELADLSRQGEIAGSLDSINADFADIQSRLSNFLGENYLQNYSGAELTEFYLYVNLQASILTGIVQCANTLQALDWEQLRGNKF